jgi:hypothetical protein
MRIGRDRKTVGGVGAATVVVAVLVSAPHPVVGGNVSRPGIHQPMNVGGGSNGWRRGWRMFVRSYVGSRYAEQTRRQQDAVLFSRGGESDPANGFRTIGRYAARILTVGFRRPFRHEYSIETQVRALLREAESRTRSTHLTTGANRRCWLRGRAVEPPGYEPRLAIRAM